MIPVEIRTHNGNGSGVKCPGCTNRFNEADLPEPKNTNSFYVVLCTDCNNILKLQSVQGKKTLTELTAREFFYLPNDLFNSICDTMLEISKSSYLKN